MRQGTGGRGTERGERRERQSEQEEEGEDKCNGLAIKRKVDGMHREDQNISE